MSEHKATIKWIHSQGEFLKGSYSREHTWTFDGGVTVPASPSPTSVKPPYSNAANVDPEEAYVAAISSCHMLFFLSIAAKHGHRIDDYVDDAEGFLETDAAGLMWMTRVVLHPQVVWSGDTRPSVDDISAMHNEAHHLCYIANSVKATIDCVPR